MKSTFFYPGSRLEPHPASIVALDDVQLVVLEQIVQIRAERIQREADDVVVVALDLSDEDSAQALCNVRTRWVKSSHTCLNRKSSGSVYSLTTVRVGFNDMFGVI